MRSVYILFVIAIVIHVSAADSCPPENCLPANNCESTVTGARCPNTQRTCCSVVKSQFRTACRHHGGECMDSCSQSLQRSVTDCPTDEVCCVLV